MEPALTASTPTLVTVDQAIPVATVKPASTSATRAHVRTEQPALIMEGTINVIVHTDSQAICVKTM